MGKQIAKFGFLGNQDRPNRVNKEWRHFVLKVSNIKKILSIHVLNGLLKNFNLQPIVLGIMFELCWVESVNVCFNCHSPTQPLGELIILDDHKKFAKSFLYKILINIDRLVKYFIILTWTSKTNDIYSTCVKGYNNISCSLWSSENQL